MDRDNIYYVASLTKENNRSIPSSVIEDTVVVAVDRTECSDLYLILLQSFVEREDGIQVVVDYEVDSQNESFVLNTFHGDKGDPISTSSYTYKFPYYDFCEGVVGCSRVLRIRHQWQNMVNGSYLVVDPGTVTLLTSLTNHAVEVGDVTLFQIIPRDMFFFQAINTNTNQTLPCLVKDRILQCRVGVIKENKALVLEIKYEIRQALTDKLSVSVQSSLNSNFSDEMVFEKYSVTPVRTLYADVKRFSQPGNFLIVDTRDEQWVDFRNIFFISLLYPGDREFVHFLLPIAGRTVALSASKIDIQYGRAEMKCAWDNITHTAEEFELLRIVQPCHPAGCDVLTCEVRPKSQQVTVKASFHLSVNLKNWGFVEEIIKNGYSSYLCYKSGFVILGGGDPFCRNILTRFKDIARTETDGRVHYWFVTLAVFAGVAIILVLSFVLWKCGFFYRKALQELKLKTEIQKLSYVHLLQERRNSSEGTDSETFVLTPFPSGSDDTQVLTPPPGYREATQRISNSSTECFFTYDDDDDGYLKPVFDIT